jgi:hypothetical protein
MSEPREGFSYGSLIRATVDRHQQVAIFLLFSIPPTFTHKGSYENEEVQQTHATGPVIPVEQKPDPLGPSALLLLS